MAIDWTIARSGSLRYVRVDYTTRQELGELTTILPGGSTRRDLDSDLKDSGSLPCVAPVALGDDLVRIYYDAEDDNGETESVALATMHAVKAQSKYSAAAEQSTLTLISALLTLQEAALQESLTLAAGSVAVTQAAALCTALGLPVVPSASTKELTADASWDKGTPKLKILNWLLDFAAFWSAQVDGYGRVVLTPYEDPEARMPVWDFAAGANCIFVPDVTQESDAFSVPNVCILTSSNAEATISGSYENVDPNSPYSAVKRGREIALAETVDDAIDEADLNARAQKRLLAATAATERLTIRHTYAPIRVGEAVRFSWPTHGLSMKATVQSQDFTLTTALPVTTTLKRVWGS